MNTLLACGVVALAVGKYFDHTLKIAHYRLKSAKIIGAPFKIVMFGDLHNQIWGEKQKNLLQLITQQEPDLVLLVGDMFDEKTQPSGSLQLLDGLKGLPMFYVSGNHEYLSQNPGAVWTKYREKGVRILDDHFEQFTNKKGSLIIGGINDPEAISQGYTIQKHAALLEIFKNISQSPDYSILMVHKPEQYTRYRQYGFDLVVSGHTHGGQVRIPYLLNGLYSANQGFFPRRAGGLYQDPCLTQIVNRGASNPYPLVPRFWNSPEICVIELAKLS